MGMYDTWPDPSLRMKNPDDPENRPGPEPPPHAAPPDPAAERARKAVRARALTDPLGAKGQRDSRRRIAREGRARRLATIGAAVSFAGSLGFITWNAHLSGNGGGGGSVESPGVALAESNSSVMSVIDPTSTPAVAATTNRSVAVNGAGRASDDENDDEHDGDHDDHDDDHSPDNGALSASNASTSTSSITASSSTAAGSSAPSSAPSTSHVTSHSS